MRRIHYSGKYPKHFQEKYKELQPDKYGAMAEHVTRKGNTPAGTHLPIMVREILEQLRIRPGDKGFDATLGYGGHTRAMLDALEGRGQSVRHRCRPYRDCQNGTTAAGRGIRRRHPDHPAPEFRRHPAPGGGIRPLRFHFGRSGHFIHAARQPGPGLHIQGRRSPGPAYEPRKGRVGGAAPAQARPGSGGPGVPLRGELRRALCRSHRPHDQRRPAARRSIETTGALRNEIASALSFLPRAEQKDAVKKSCARVFQALRIDVNGELEALYTFLDALPDVLSPGGRVAVLTFHSGEDRLVKKPSNSFGKKAASPTWPAT